MILDGVIKAAEAAIKAEPGDYPQDGILYCGRCHTPKQCKIAAPDGNTITVKCLCECGKAQREKDEAERRKQELVDKLDRLRKTGIANQALRTATFANDDGANPKPFEMCRRYAEKWRMVKAENIGLLLYGGVGTGKSYAAACIANELIDARIPVMMTNFSNVLNALSGFGTADKNTYIADLVHYPLLILDDFGMERNTDFALEQVFNVIDARYRSGKPLIVTTNLTLDALLSPQDIAHERIYDRVLEMCTPICFGGNGRRRGRAEAKMDKLREVLR